MLDRLCSLHALARIEAERAFYQEHGRLSATQSKAVIKAVNALCAEVRERRGAARRRLRRAPRRPSAARAALEAAA